MLGAWAAGWVAGRVAGGGAEGLGVVVGGGGGGGGGGGEGGELRAVGEVPVSLEPLIQGVSGPCVGE